MRCLVQRVSQANVVIDGTEHGKIGYGMAILICSMHDDDAAAAIAMSKKISKLRIFSDADGRMNRSIIDIGGQALVVSQFTLAANTSRGNRPSFIEAANPDIAKSHYKLFISELQSLGIPVETGVFGAEMQLTLTNNGPVTIWLDINK